MKFINSLCKCDSVRVQLDKKMQKRQKELETLATIYFEKPIRVVYLDVGHPLVNKDGTKVGKIH